MAFIEFADASIVEFAHTPQEMVNVARLLETFMRDGRTRIIARLSYATRLAQKTIDDDAGYDGDTMENVLSYAAKLAKIVGYIDDTLSSFGCGIDRLESAYTYSFDGREGMPSNVKDCTLDSLRYLVDTMVEAQGWIANHCQQYNESASEYATLRDDERSNYYVTSAISRYNRV